MPDAPEIVPKVHRTPQSTNRIPHLQYARIETTV